LFGQVARLANRLILTPLARRQAGIAIVPAAVVEGRGGRDDSRHRSARERGRLLRG
jgi:hypothetical protein